MASLIQSPFQRLSYPSVDNPVYSQDIVAANQEVLDMITALAGLGPADFAIAGGLTYEVAVSGSNYYLPGFFYLTGVWYYMPFDFDEGLRLAPNVTGIMDYTYQDAITQPQYNEYLAQATSSPTGATPIFSGNMNAYRIDNTTLLAAIKVLQLATALQNVQVAVLPASYTVNFTNDKAIFFASATVNTAIHFDMTGAIPGTVVTLQWTFAGSLTLSIPPTTNQTILLESGDQTNVGANINILTCLYAGIDSVANYNIRLTLSQPTTTT